MITIVILNIREIDVLRLLLVLIAVTLYIFYLYMHNSSISKVSIIDVLDFREIGVFNSREIAIFIFFGFLFTILYFKSKVSINPILKALFVKRIIILFVVFFLHFSVIIFLLYSIGFWEPSFWKDSVIWLVFTGISTVLAINKVDKNKNYFKDLVLDNIKISAVVEFVVGQHTFNVFLELLILAISSIIAIFLAFSRDNEHIYVRNFLNTVAIIIGSIMLFFSVYEIFSSINDYTTFEKFEEFSLPIVLALWFVPFFYVLYLYMKYDSMLRVMELALKGKKIIVYAKIQALINFRTDIKSLERWVRSLHVDEPKTKNDVDESIKNIKNLKIIESNPPSVNISEGWSPYKSKDFLKNDGIETNFYNNYDEDIWGASSLYIKLGDDIITDDGKYYAADLISYYISGNNTVVKELKLVLGINSKLNEDLSISRFYKYISSLYKASTDNSLSDVVIQSIKKRKNKTLYFEHFKVSVEFLSHNNKDKTYRIVFAIVHK